MSTEHRHYDCTPGLVTGGMVVKEVHSCNGQHYWKAVEQIGCIFGSEVEGELVAFGHTKEQAIEHLAEERRKLHESLFA